MSILLSLFSTAKNLYVIVMGANENNDDLYDHIMNILDFGIGHIPHIAAMRMGQGTEFDFCEVESKLMAENKYFGLKRICDAIVDGGSTERITFTDVTHDVRQILDVSLPGDDGETDGPGLQERVEIVLSEVSGPGREPRDRAEGFSVLTAKRSSPTFSTSSPSQTLLTSRATPTHPHSTHAPELFGHRSKVHRRGFQSEL